MNVLIAEDDYRVADIHCQYVKSLKQVNEVKTVATAKETLLELKSWQPDLILLDVYLPDQTGIDLIHQLKEECLTVQVILITAATDISILKDAYNLGVIDYLVKPIELQRLSDAIEKVSRNNLVLNSQQKITQTMADQLFQFKNIKKIDGNHLPKGIDQLTLEKVRELLQQQKEGITAEELGKLLGASRTTSRRYLEYLISIREAKAELVYGIVGRPERKYYVVSSE